MKDFLKEIGFAVSVCDKEGTINYLNDRGAITFQDQGGQDLLGSNILDCHPEPSKSRLKEMMVSHETQTIIKGEGERRRLILQTPIYKEGEFNGYAEFIIPLSAI